MSYIYLLKCYSDPIVWKIGFSKNDPSIRVKQLSTGNPWPIELYACFDTKYGQEVERVLHRRYSRLRHRLEWFWLTQEMADNFLADCRTLEDNLSLIKH